MKDLILTNIETVPGRSIVDHFGVVSGSTMCARHFGRDLAAKLKYIIGGELKCYTDHLRESRNEAIRLMVEQAKALGANAVINIYFSTSTITQGTAEVYVYGAAVRVE